MYVLILFILCFIFFQVYMLMIPLGNHSPLGPVDIYLHNCAQE